MEWIKVCLAALVILQCLFRPLLGRIILHLISRTATKQEKYPNAIVADFGCGEAELSASISNKCYSFDLSDGGNDRIIACDMAHVPLSDQSVDIVVFCLRYKDC